MPAPAPLPPPLPPILDLGLVTQPFRPADEPEAMAQWRTLVEAGLLGAALPLDTAVAAARAEKVRHNERVVRAHARRLPVVGAPA